MRAREVNQRIERLGGVAISQRGSHRKYTAIAGNVRAQTIVAQHAGDIPTGTLRAIQRDMEPVFGKGWLIP